jgi:hypothetical protein
VDKEFLNKVDISRRIGLENNIEHINDFSPEGLQRDLASLRVTLRNLRNPFFHFN